jgi:hypothetical protein
VTVGSDCALDRTHACRNEVEDLERSGKLCGRAIEDNENAEGETKSEDHLLGWNGMKSNGSRVLLTQARERARAFTLARLSFVT